MARPVRAVLGFSAAIAFSSLHIANLSAGDAVFTDGFEFICPTYYNDTDGDGFGNPDTANQTCDAQPPDTVLNGDDCNDGVFEINPDAVELAPDTIYVDENCDGVDGNVGLAVLVSQLHGTDTASCGTLEEPCQTITKGLQRVSETGVEQVYIQEASYPESIDIDQDVALFGGYAASDWGRAFRTVYQSRVAGSGASDSGYSVNVMGVQAGFINLYVDGQDTPVVGYYGIAGDPGSSIVIRDARLGVNDPSGSALLGSNLSGLTVENTAVVGAGAAGIILFGAASGMFNFDGLTVINTGVGINIHTHTGGTFNFPGPLTIETTSGAGIFLSNNTGATFNFLGGLDLDTTSGTGFTAVAGGTVNIDGTNTINSQTGRILDWDGITIGGTGVTFTTLGASGTIPNPAITLNNVDGGMFNGGNVSIAGTSVGDGIFIGGGSSATFQFASATIDNVADDAIDLDGSGNGAVTFTTVDLDGAAGGGLEISSNTNAVNVNGGSIGSTNDPAGDAVNINGGSGNVTIAAIITKTTGNNVFQVLNRTGGTVTSSGALSATGGSNNGIDIQNNTGGTINITGASKILSTANNTAVNLNNNTGTTINFTGGGLDIDTTSGDGFRAVGGGTIVVQGGATVDTTTGTGIFIQNTTIGSAGVSFDSVNTNGLGGGTTGGIFVANTGSVGGSAFVVNGGNIQNAQGASLGAGAMSTTGDGIGVYLESVQNVTLSGLTINQSDNFGIRGFSLSGTTNFTNVTLSGNHGNVAASDEAAVSLDNISGFLFVASGTYGGGHEDTFAINNTSGILTADFSAVTFNPNQIATGDNGLQLVTSGSATANLNVNGSAFNGARSVMLFVDLGGSGGGAMNFGETSPNTFTQNQINLPGGGAIEVIASGSGNTATVYSNILSSLITAGTNTFEGDVIVVGTGFGFAGAHNITLTGNTIGTNGMNGSAVNPVDAQGDDGIVLSTNGTGNVTALIENNAVYDYNSNGFAMVFDAEGPSVPAGGVLNVSVLNNTFDDSLGSVPGNGILVLGSDNIDACVNISSNTVDNPLGRDIEIDVFETGGAGFYRVPGLVTLTEAGIDAHYTANNTITAPADVTVFSMTGYTISGSPGCSMP